LQVYGELQVTALMPGLQFRSTNCRSFRCDLDSRAKDRMILWRYWFEGKINCTRRLVFNSEKKNLLVL